MNSVAISAAAAFLVPIAMAFLARVFPVNGAAQSADSLETLTARFAKWEIGITFLYLALWAPVTAAIWIPLQVTSELVADLLAPAEFLITPGPVFWLLPALLLALAAATLPATWIARRLLEEQFKDYETYLQLKHNMDIARANRLAYIGIGWLFAVAVALGLNWYVLVRTDEFVLNPFFGIREIVHPYSDVQAIQTAEMFVAPNGNVVPRQEFLIRFRDGSTWSTRNLPATLSGFEKRSMLEAVSVHSGVPIEELEIFGKGAI